MKAVENGFSLPPFFFTLILLSGLALALGGYYSIVSCTYVASSLAFEPPWQLKLMAFTLLPFNLAYCVLFVAKIPKMVVNRLQGQLVWLRIFLLLMLTLGIILIPNLLGNALWHSYF